MLYCPNFFWNVLQVWMTGKDVYLQMTWSWPDKTWNILCSYCLQWNTSQSKFRNHYFLFLFAFSILSQLFLIWGCSIFVIDYEWACLHLVISCVFADRISIWFDKTFPFTLGHINLHKMDINPIFNSRAIFQFNEVQVNEIKRAAFY